MSLYNEYRPTEFEDVFGQDDAVKLFKSILEQPFKKRPKTFLIAGPSGSGKTCLAYIYARKMGCEPGGFDFRTLDASKDRSIDKIRAEVDLMGSSPMNRNADSRVWLIDECFSGKTSIRCFDPKTGEDYFLPIEEIVNQKRQALVWSLSKNKEHEPKPITGWFSNGVKQVFAYYFYLSDNFYEVIECTPNHTLFREDMSEVAVGCLNVGERVLVDGAAGLRTARLGSVRKLSEVPVYDIEVADNHNYIANGVIAHNCHQLLTAAQEALLKVSEEPPPKTTIIFATTLPEKMGTALKSRCKTITVNALSNKDMALNMVRVAEKAGIAIDVESVKRLVIAAEGNTRASIQLLENYMLNGGNVDAAIAMTTGASSKLVADTQTLCRAIINKNADWSIVRDFMSAYKGQHESVRQAILGYLKACLLGSKTIKDRQRFTMLMECFIQPFYGNEEAGLVYQLSNAWDVK